MGWRHHREWRESPLRGARFAGKTPVFTALARGYWLAFNPASKEPTLTARIVLIALLGISVPALAQPVTPPVAPAWPTPASPTPPYAQPYPAVQTYPQMYSPYGYPAPVGYPPAPSLEQQAIQQRKRTKRALVGSGSGLLGGGYAPMMLTGDCLLELQQRELWELVVSAGWRAVRDGVDRDQQSRWNRGDVPAG